MTQANKSNSIGKDRRHAKYISARSIRFPRNVPLCCLCLPPMVRITGIAFEESSYAAPRAISAVEQYRR